MSEGAGGRLLDHPCCVCGDRGILGVGVALRRDELGMWWCGDCFPGWPDAEYEWEFELQRRADAAKAQKEVQP